MKREKKRKRKKKRRREREDQEVWKLNLCMDSIRFKYEFSYFDGYPLAQI